MKQASTGSSAQEEDSRLLNHRDCQSYHCFYMIFGGDARIFCCFSFGSCLVVGKSNLNIVKESYHFPTVHEINIFIIF